MRKVLSLLFFSISAPLLATVQQLSYIKLDNGYRWDKTDNRVVLYANDETHLAASEIVLNKIQSYQLGGTARWFVFCPLYVKATGHYGWIGSGNYREVFFHGDVDGNTWDVSGGVGYLLCLHPCWGIAPTVGWTYDALDLKATHITSNKVVIPTPSLSNIDCKNTFNGPWVGLDLIFQPSNCFELDLSYELHRGEWKMNRIPDQGDFGSTFGTTSGFANKRNHHKVWGQAFQIEGTYFLCRCWSLGLALKYQVWKGQNTGHYKRTITPLNPGFTNQAIVDLDWQSFVSFVRLGYHF